MQMIKSNQGCHQRLIILRMQIRWNDGAPVRNEKAPPIHHCRVNKTQLVIDVRKGWWWNLEASWSIVNCKRPIARSHFSGDIRGFPQCMQMRPPPLPPSPPPSSVDYRSVFFLAFSIDRNASETKAPPGFARCHLGLLGSRLGSRLKRWPCLHSTDPSERSRQLE